MERKPLIIVDGQLAQLPASDTLAGVATAAQGAKADSALQPRGDGSGLAAVTALWNALLNQSVDAGTASSVGTATIDCGGAA